MKQNSYYDKDYCLKCWRGVLSNRSSAKQATSKGVLLMYKKDPTLLTRKSKSMMGKNKGELNGMKNIEVRKKASFTHKNIMSIPANRLKIAKGVSQAWKDGKYDGVNVGRSKWFSYLHSNGRLYKVQGTWELKFIEWLDKNNLTFDCHKGRLKYKLYGYSHSYYPDFFISAWDCYIDVKAEYFYNLQLDKFKAIRQYNPIVKLKILLGNELKLMNII